ncbi:uncharacterized protein DSM5745_05376 [Aspergillus mulundensis]|uniref:Uncharacterized protein n=1 Tax=Aspergillus mulundensis TaxID=1810919 RepID=A0A3D8RXF7_9EURO|nr:Uncharacterized protein DSM5745_05376 [Aspergillus mulundensis]RDW78524.1 Uncharacterized protein DSM5745_05376 [Aspergillus mulundensis]
MPTTSNNASPVKRPGLGRRAVSSHAVVTRSSSSSTQGELSHSHTSHTSQPQQRPSGHRAHRAHLVGGGHRSHGRNPSFGKNLGKLQRHLSSGHVGPEYRLHQHQRKKSAPVTPVASPPRQHVHWDGIDDASPRTTGSIKKNYSSPALRRSNSSVLPKKALVTDRPHTSSGKKKTVGFELADSTDEGEWEDTTQSPESTRRSSVAQSRDGDENPVVLVDPLTFVKRSYPQFPRATSLPEPASRSFHDDQSSGEDDEHIERPKEQSSDTEEAPEESGRAPEQGDIASRLLSPSHSAKAPPAMSSISATATPAPVDTLSRNASLTNLASGQDGLRRPMSTANIVQASTPSQAPGSSSIEGGVSRFINNRIATSRTDSDPNTPSSFLPHYHPQTPPSPKGTKKTRSSPSSRQPGTEPPSRTQQKLWLQRTAALNNSPPDSHGASASVSPSVTDPAYMSGNARVGPGPYDTARALVNGASRNGGALHQSEAKHIRKAYEKAAMELTVVRRFQSPTGASFTRLNAIIKDSRGGLGQPVKSAPALVLLQRGAKQQDGTSAGSAESKQLVGRKQADPVSQAYVQDPEDPPHPSHRLLSTSDDAAHGSGTHGTDDDHEGDRDPFLPSEADMMIRRMWESREVATSG